MTYKELLEKLKRLSPEQLEQNVEVIAIDENFSFGDEFFPVNDLLTNGDHIYILDPNHPYLVFYK